MRRIGTKRAIFVGVVGLIVGVALCACAQSDDRVLLIFSYHAEYVWHAEEARGAEEILQRESIAFEHFYLDTKRHTSDEWKEQVAAQAKDKIAEYDPAVVIVFDDNACALVAQHYVGESLPFVFCGVNADPADYGFPARNVTGVLERPDFVASFELLQKLVPNVQDVALITDASPSAQGFIEGLEGVPPPAKIIETYSTNDFDAWKAKVKELQSLVDAIGLFTYHTIKKQGEEESMSPDEVLQWTLDNSGLPETAPLDFTVEGGALCGVALSGYEQGKTAAKLAIRILAGENPSDIPLVIPQASRFMVNAGRAVELGIEISQDALVGIELVDCGSQVCPDRRTGVT